MSRIPQRPNFLYLMQAALGIAIIVLLVLIINTFATLTPGSDHDNRATIQKQNNQRYEK